MEVRLGPGRISDRVVMKHRRGEIFRDALETTAALIAVLMFAVAGIAAAADPHTGGSTGQPNQSCQNPATSTTPGNAVNGPGSPYNPSGVSGGKYAGTQTQNSKNSHSVAQYDVACFQNSQPH